MKIKMLNTTPGSRFGPKVEKFTRDEEYDVPDKLGNAFISMAVAEEVKVKSERAPVEEQKDAGKAPENKSAGKAPERASRRK